jgi:hypothetical protein
MNWIDFTIGLISGLVLMFIGMTLLGLYSAYKQFKRQGLTLSQGMKVKKAAKILQEISKEVSSQEPGKRGIT